MTGVQTCALPIYEGHGGGDLPALGRHQLGAEGIEARDLEGLTGPSPTHRHGPAQRRPALTQVAHLLAVLGEAQDRKSTRLNSSHANISYAVFCLKKKKTRH